MADKDGVDGAGRDQERLERWRAERREVAKRMHPDRGGDPDAFVQAMRAVDARHGLTQPAPATGGFHADVFVTVRSPTLLRRLRRLRRRLLRTQRAVRSRLPRGWPGARRYTRL